MNWDAIGAVGETIGALAVVISVLYLALQIRQNTSHVRSSGYQAAAQTGNNFLEGLASNPEALRVFHIAQESYVELSDEDRRLAHTLIMQLFLMYESLYYQYEDEVVDPDMWEGRRKMMFGFLSKPGISAWWSEWSPILGEKFVSYVSKNHDSSPDSKVPSWG
jgi:hypothetical protein